MALTPGTRLGPYEIGAQIGVGGMGEVYRAADTKLGRDVAVKVLPSLVARDAERLARFDREARTLASLNHPNIAQIYGIEESDGIKALVMELVDGPTLQDVIAGRSATDSGSLPRVSAPSGGSEARQAAGVGPRGILIEEALGIARQIAEALETAHEHGIIHRDLKPANIKLKLRGAPPPRTEDDRLERRLSAADVAGCTVKVLDFGLAKFTEAQGSGLRAQDGLTHSPTITSPAMLSGVGMILGTAAYMSPEQARGKPVDARADIWAFGCVLFEMLSGRRAFEADDVSLTLARVLEREVDVGALPAGVPPHVQRVIGLCLQKDPRRRVQAIGDVRLALEGSFATAAAPVAEPEKAARPIWRRAIPFALTAAAAALVAGLVGVRLRPAPEPGVLTRFDYEIPEGQSFRLLARQVVALSPDGRAFVYNTQAGLYLRTMGELDARLIPGTEEPSANPFFAPDGQSVAYFVIPSSLKRIAVSGGAPVLVAGGVGAPFGASWGADGTIVFGQPQGIMRVPATGGTPELVVATKDGETVYGPQLLPDGDSLLFSVTSVTGDGTTTGDAARWDKAKVVVQSLSSGVRTELVQGGSDARYLPTGHLLYALGSNLLAVAFDLDRLAVTGAAVSPVQGVWRANNPGLGTAAANYGISEQGTLLYLAGSAGTSQKLVWVNRDGSGQRIETIPTGTTPRLSPGGQRVLVEADGDLWIYDVASGRRSRVTRDGASERGAWDPTGASVAYTSARGGNQQVWISPADGSGEPRQLTSLDGGQVHVDSWSPDGRTLAVHQHTEKAGADILMVPIGGTDAAPQAFLVREPAEADAVFSPDGRYVAYRSTETGQNEIYIRPFPGPGGQETVSVGGGQQPVWADSGELFYRDLTGERMMVVPLVTRPALKVGTPRLLFRGNYVNTVTGPGSSPRPHYDVTADGKRLVMLEAENSARPRIIVVQNWLEELKRLLPTN